MNRAAVIALLPALLGACTQELVWTLEDVDGGRRTEGTWVPPFGTSYEEPPDEPRVQGPHCAACAVPLRLLFEDERADLRDWTVTTRDEDVAVVLDLEADGGDLFFDLLFWADGQTSVDVHDGRGWLVGTRSVRAEWPSQTVVEAWSDRTDAVGDEVDVGDAFALLEGGSASFQVHWRDADGARLTGTGALVAAALPVAPPAVPGEPTDTDADTDADSDTDTDSDAPVTPDAPQRPVRATLDVFVDTDPFQHVEAVTVSAPMGFTAAHELVLRAAERPMRRLRVDVVTPAQITGLQLMADGGRPVPASGPPPAAVVARVEANGVRVVGAPVRWTLDGRREGTGQRVLLEPAGGLHTLEACLTDVARCASIQVRARVVSVEGDQLDGLLSGPGCRRTDGCSQAGSNAMPALWALGALLGLRRRRARRG